MSVSLSHPACFNVYRYSTLNTSKFPARAGKLLHSNPENAGNMEKRAFGPAPLQRSQTRSGWDSEFDFAPGVHETGMVRPGFNFCDPEVSCTKMLVHGGTMFDEIIEALSGITH